MKNLFRFNIYDTKASVGILIFRLVLGTALMLHGWGKIQNPMGWMGENGPPGILQFLAAISEFGGGLSWILGLLVPLSSFGIFCTMTFAVYVHAFIKGDPFVGQGGSFEPALIYAVSAVLLFLAGPGRYSLDRKFFRIRNQNN